MRKKKLRLLAVLLAACMLCSCSAPVYPRSTDEPQLQFYYCTGEGADTGIGALAARPVSVPDERPDAVLQQYLTAPAGEGFSLPDGLSSSCAFDSCEDGTLPLLALQALVSREVPVNLTRAIPYRTQVLDLSVTNGSASVVLSDDFMSCDVSAQQAANAVRAIAATLCALDSITAVQLSVIGETGLTYYDISQPITPQADWYAE